jgi:KDO2-lipid IV(A) lauroyltransferase
MSSLVGYIAIAALSIVSRLPEALLIGIARAWGRVGPSLQRDRAAMGRKNLSRVYTFRDGAAPTALALDRGVQLLFEHHLRFYIETARAPRHARTIIATRVRIENEEAVRAAFVRGEKGAIFLAAHFGAIELPGSILADRSGMRPVAPMEELGNEVLQRWMLRVRGEGLGLRIIPARGAAAVMADELAAGGIVGVVGDRNIVGRGVPVSLFGAPARLPIGPGLLAVESNARLFVAAVIREEKGRYTGYIRQVQIPDHGDRMERTKAALTGVAAAFEELISKAPEQWWTLFYSIWDDPQS